MYDRQTQNTIFVTQQLLQEQTRDKTFDRLTAMTILVFIVLVAVWVADQALVQVQIWYNETTLWAVNAVSVVSSYWPF